MIWIYALAAYAVAVFMVTGFMHVATNKETPSMEQRSHRMETDGES